MIAPFLDLLFLKGENEYLEKMAKGQPDRKLLLLPHKYNCSRRERTHPGFNLCSRGHSFFSKKYVQIFCYVFSCSTQKSCCKGFETKFV
jgi:hypothetical protein